MGAGVTETGGGRRRKRRSAYTPMHEINVTPFVDVMLVLLIVFMVTAPLLTVGVPIELPETRANPIQGDSEPLTEARQTGYPDHRRIYPGFHSHDGRQHQ
jgi:biopolymer transport protein TolR